MTEIAEIDNEEKDPGGRPPFEITDDILEQVQDLASKGLFKKQVAAVLGISYHTYNEKTKEYPKLADAYLLGRGIGVGDMVMALHAEGIGGDVSAQKHFLKHMDKEHWGDVQVTEHLGYIANEKPKDITDNMTEKEAAETYAAEVLAIEPE